MKGKGPSSLINRVSARFGLTRELPSVIQLGLAFMFVFTGFDTQAYVTETALHSIALKEPHRIDPHAGYYGLAITYLTFTSSCFLTPLILGWIGAKWSMFLASLAYTAFMTTFVMVNSYMFYAMSAIMGFAAALLWNAHGVYMREITTPGNASRNSGLHWGLNFGSLLFGGILLLLIFRSTGQSQVMSMEVITYIFEGLSIFTILSNVLFFLLPDFSERSAASKASFRKTIGRIFMLLRDRRMLLLSAIFMYNGFVLSFYISIYPSCLSFSKSLVGAGNEIIAYFALVTSFGQIAGGFFVSFMSKKIYGFGYMPTMLMTIPINLITFAGIYITFPSDANTRSSLEPTMLAPSLLIWLFLGLLLAIGDSFWNTIRTACLTALYSKNSSQAFALSKFFQSMMACASFFFTGSISLHAELLLLTVFLGFACIAFTFLYRITGTEQLDVHENPGDIYTIEKDKVAPCEPQSSPANIVELC